jgi:DNA repair protein RecN (Recombination protein N)
MLRSLYIKNYALIDEFSVTFERGLNIITGETGAGKSIVLGAFGLLIGDRASADVVRAGADKAVVEAEFESVKDEALHALLIEKELQGDGNALIIRREVTQRGTSRAFVNDSPVTAQILKELGEKLVDLHGQHEHQSLLHRTNHVSMLDSFGDLTPIVEDYQDLRRRALALSNEIDTLHSQAGKFREEHDLYAFQLQEIMTVDPSEGEDDKIEEELRILENAEELCTSASQIHSILYNDEGSAYEKLGSTKEQLVHLAAIDSSLEEPLKEAKSALAIVEELSKWLDRYSDRIELDPERLAKLRERQQQIQRLKKKYGGSLTAVLAKKIDLEGKLSFEQNFDEALAAKQRELQASLKELASRAEKLSKARRDVAQMLEPQIAAALNDLGIEQSQFKVEIASDLATETTQLPLAIKGKQIEANARGIDNVEFYISTNAGEEPKPLAKVASGGEISRIMLALKTILARNERLPLMVFDEIDIGISGRVAQRVGRAMKALSQDHQIISITHLAQIAACGDSHYLAEKKVVKGMTSSQLRRLDEGEHVAEVARLISGDALTASSLENAKALIEEANSKSSSRKEVAVA